ncbi:MAG TPA: hypothetical protein VFN57_10580 [Thermomicrobiaceae bacterium]|nr:hypothetical protein [Thermomicrobiaceae bacterium]
MGDERAPAGGEHDHVSDAELAAYVDGEIESVDRRRAIAAHLEECAMCRQTLRELMVLVGALAELPQPEPTRSYRLTPAMVPAPAPLTVPWFIRFQPAMRWATAAAALLLVLVVGADVVTHAGGAATTASPSSAPRVLTSASSAASTSAPAARPSAASPAAAAAPFPAASSPPARAAAGVAPATPGAVAAAGPAGAATSPSGGAPPPSGWRIAELGLTLVLLWLLVATVALPRTRRARS